MKIPGYDTGIKGLGKPRVNDVKTGRKEGGRSSRESSSAAQSSEASTVNVSSVGRDIFKASEIAKSAPDIRTEVVDRIAREVQSGSYHVDSRDIAGKILKDIFSA